MKHLFLLLSFVFSLLNVCAQKKYENSYLSMTIPDGWEVQNMDVPGANMELLSFFNSGSQLYNIGMVMGIEQMQDPSYVLQNQMNLRSNILFKEAKFGSIHKSTFMGKPAQSVDFETTIDNVSFKGAAYAFNEGGCSLLSIGCYKVGAKSNLPQIWRSIKWKQHQRNESKFKTLREELLQYTTALNDLWSRSPLISNGEQAISMQLEENEDCLVYTYRLIEIERSQFTDEQLSYLQNTIRENLIPMLKSQASQAELLRRCMEEQYVFKYIYQDKNGEFLCSVKVVPDDYKQY